MDIGENMIQDKTKELIKKGISVETENAINTWGDKYNSLHEGYAVLKEEIEEVKEQTENLESNIEAMWRNIRVNRDGVVSYCIRSMTGNLQSLIAEAFQCCAVINKIQNTINEMRGKKDD